MTRSHRNEDRGGEHRWAFNGVEYPTRKLMCEARRAEYVRLPDEEGMNFTQAAHAVGVSKRTGKAWRNGNPGTATTSPAAPGRRPRTGSNAPNRARRPRTVGRDPRRVAQALEPGADSQPAEAGPPG